MDDRYVGSKIFYTDMLANLLLGKNKANLTKHFQNNIGPTA